MKLSYKITKTKAVEFYLFEKHYPCWIDLNIFFTSKRHETDCYGFSFCFALCSWIIFQFRLYDVQHIENHMESEYSKQILEEFLNESEKDIIYFKEELKKLEEEKHEI